MHTDWEYTLLLLILGPVGMGLLSYVVLRELLHWFAERSMRPPIYGPADLYRTRGPNARQNQRRGA